MRTKLTTLGLTGGIATGKSTCCAIFRDLCSAVVVFDADASVAQLYSDPQVIAQISSHFGSEVDNGHGGINKTWLRTSSNWPTWFSGMKVQSACSETSVAASCSHLLMCNSVPHSLKMAKGHTSMHNPMNLPGKISPCPN